MQRRKAPERAAAQKIQVIWLSELMGVHTPEECAALMCISLEAWEKCKADNLEILKTWDIAYRCNLCDEKIKGEAGGLGFTVPDDPHQGLSFTCMSEAAQHICARCGGSIGALSKIKLPLNGESP